MSTHTLKTQIIEGLTAFIHQRPGIEPGNYGSWKDYRSESRQVTRDLHDAGTLLRAVMWRDSLTGEDLLRAFPNAFSGRLTCERMPDGRVRLDYCTGQYFPTEYRRAACAVLSSALWEWTRQHAMPQPRHRDGVGGAQYAINGQIQLVSPGDWLRRHFRKEFGARLAGRYFD
jgi:hypothetical protein